MIMMMLLLLMMLLLIKTTATTMDMLLMMMMMMMMMVYRQINMFFDVTVAYDSVEFKQLDPFNLTCSLLGMPRTYKLPCILVTSKEINEIKMMSLLDFKNETSHQCDIHL